MAASIKKQIWLNFWRCWITKKRQPVLLFFEICWPIVIFGVIIILHTIFTPVEFETCQFRARANPSVGLLPYAQSYMCNVKNDCFNLSTFQDIPTYPGSKVDTIVEYGGPIVENSTVQEALKAIPVGLKLIHGIVQVFNDSQISDILENGVKVRNLFKNSSRLESFLVDISLSQNDSNRFMEAELNYLQIVKNLFQSSDTPVFGASCDPVTLSQYFISEHPESIDKLAEGLCSIYDDEEVVRLARTVHQNLNIDALLQRGVSVFEEVSKYNLESASEDLMKFLETIFNVTFSEDEVPPILQFELWIGDLEDLFNSIRNGSEKFDFTVLDSVANLTLKVYLDPRLYEMLMRTVGDLTEAVKDLTFCTSTLCQNSTLTKDQNSLKVKRMSNELPTWENFADEIEIFIRQSLECKNMDSECLYRFLENVIKIFENQRGTSHQNESNHSRIQGKRERSHLTNVPERSSDQQSLAKILKCWSQDKRREPCKWVGDIASISSELLGILRDLEIRNSLISKLLNGTEVYSTLSSTVMSLVPIESCFVLNNLEESLIETGMSSDVVQKLLSGRINVNRLVFHDTRITEESFSSEVDFARWFNLNEFEDFEVVRRNISEIQNVAEILSQAFNISAIHQNISDWRFESFYQFDWISSSLAIEEVMFEDVKIISKFVELLIPILSRRVSKIDSGMASKIFDMFKTGILESFQESLLEFEESLVLLFGNSPESEYPERLVIATSALEAMRLLVLAQFETRVGDLFKNWEVIQEYLKSEFELTGVDTDELKKASLNIPKILSGSEDEVTEGGSFSFDMICEPEKLSQFVTLDLETLKNISSALCDLGIQNFVKFLEIVFEEIDIEEIVKLMTKVNLDDILSASNVTKDEAVEATQALKRGFEIFPQIYKNVEIIVAEITEAYDENLEDVEFAGEVFCGDKNAFAFQGLTINQDEKPETNETDTPQPEPEDDKCFNLRSELTKTNRGTFLWQFLSPILQGQIFYSPADDPVTNRIMEEAHKASLKVENDLSKLRSFSYLVDGLIKISSMEEEFKFIQTLYNSSVLQDVLESLVGGKVNLTVFEEANITQIFQDLSKYQNSLESSKLVFSGLECYNTNRLVPIANETEIERVAAAQHDNGTFLAGLVFLTNQSEGTIDPQHIKYKIRMEKNLAPPTYEVKNMLWVPGPLGDFLGDLRYFHGFLQIQDLIDRSIFRAMAGEGYNKSDLESIGVYTQQFPYPCFYRDNFLSGMYTTQLLQVCLLFSFILVLSVSTKRQIWEKESQNSQIMELMGMKSIVIWSVWIVMTSMIVLVIAVELTIIVKFGRIVPLSNPFLIFFILFLFGMSVVSSSFLMSTLISKSSVGSIVSVLVMIVTFFPFMILFTLDSKLKLWHKLLTSLLSPSSFGFGFLYIGRYEQQDIGLNWDNIWTSPLEGDSYNYSYSCLMILADTVIYGLLAAFCLFLKKRDKRFFWTRPKSVTVEQDEEMPNVGGKRYGISIGVSLKCLTKVYPISKKLVKTVVKNLSLDFEVGKVTALLGHNGAGKSTTIKMMTGLVEPSTGSVTILGYDVKKEWSKVQTLIGLCPQQSVLYDALTPEEHLRFYGSLKGNLEGKELQEDVQRLLTSMDMLEVKDVPVQKLSEGMRRRICVGVAFIGKSKVVILDEPTAGVDPIARRQIWNLINEEKEDRTIILTTHHLDEAEILSDTVAIIHQGELMSHGTVSQLKSDFGCAYRLIVQSDPNTSNYFARQLTSNFASIKQFNFQAQQEDLNENEMTFILSNEVKENESSPINLKNLRKLFDFLENSIKSDFLKSYSIESKTLEDIFTKLDQEKNSVQETVIGTSESISDDINLIGNEEIRHQGFLGHIYSQIFALLYKRWKHSTRDLKFLFSSLVLPGMLLTISLSLGLMRPLTQNPPLLLTPSLYGPGAETFVHFHNMTESWAENSILSSLLESPGIGTTCLNDFPNWAEYVGCIPSNFTPFTSDYEGPGAMHDTCFCNSERWECSDGFGDVIKPPKSTTNSTDIVFDISNTSDSVMDYLLQTHFDFLHTRYGGWSVAPHGSGQANYGGKDKNLIVWYNNQGYHSAPSYLSAIHNAMLRTLFEDETDKNEAGISTYVHPLTITAGQINSQNVMQKMTDFGIALMFLISISFVPASFLPYIVSERIREEKEVQLVSGVSKVSYWIATFIWDTMIILSFMALCAMVIFLFGIDSFTARDNFMSTLSLLFFFCLSTTSLVYVLEKSFRDPNLGQLVVFCGSTVIGILTIATIMILQFILGTEATKHLVKWISKAFICLPPFALAKGLLDQIANEIKAELFLEFGVDTYVNPFSWDLIGRNITVMALETILFHTLNMMLEYNIINKFKRYFLKVTKRDGTLQQSSSKVPDDVQKELNRIDAKTAAGNDVLLIKKLTKNFGSLSTQMKIAVDNISVGVQKRECFGLLGLNGAGKSTTFKMLTGEIKPTSGSFHLAPGTKMGYCPQNDALDPYLTVKEQLKVQCLIRGIHCDSVPLVIRTSLRQFDLTQYSSVLCSNLSGGNKRKVCSVLALLDNPNLILMDEPTSGMDVVSKRLVWNHIQSRLSSGDTSVILTSHSMEECETLCSRLVIMAKGRFMCIGSPVQIKTRHGDGYSINLVFDSPNGLSQMLKFISRNFQSCQNLKLHNSTICFNVSVDESISAIFQFIWQNQNLFNLEDFSVRQTTLDEIFVRLTQTNGSEDTASR